VIAIVILVSAYLLGSVPFSYLVARMRGVDVRRVGSGNVGATNVMRSAGVPAGIAAFALDFAKGSAATVVARTLAQMYQPDRAMLLAGSAAAMAVVGHVFPVWIGFRGGKGVATGAGAFFPLAPLAAGLAIVAFALVTATSRYVSLGSIVGTLTLAVVTFVTPANAAVSTAASVSAAVIVAKHRGNIERLRRGEERRLGGGKNVSGDERGSGGATQAPPAR
jgi:acyl phosphate:glycerol-3-phosphate acyltransferase